MLTDQFIDLCKEWLKTHGMNGDNFSIAKYEVEKDKYTKTTFYFVYNKAFAKPFVNKSTISEMLYNSDFAFQMGFGDSITIEKDSQGKLGGRHGWPSSFANELEQSKLTASMPSYAGQTLVAGLDEKDLIKAIKDTDKPQSTTVPAANNNFSWPWGTP